MKATFGLLFAVFHVFYNPIDSDAIQLNSVNIESTLSENNFVFINFYAEWCRFSNMLAPIWSEAADKIHEGFKGSPTKVVMGKVDCEDQATLCHSDNSGELGGRFHVTKYPTIKYVLNGVVGKREYRGHRSVEAFMEFVKDQTRNPVTEFKSSDELKELDSKKGHLIGYMEDGNSVESANFRKIALNLKDDCDFHAGYGEAVRRLHPPGTSVFSFRPNAASSSDSDESFTGDQKNYEEFSAWVTEKCTPLVREITFENAEELTEEGLPFLILFHDPAETESVKKFNNVVKTQLLGDKGTVNFLTADGIKFAHPLLHLGKSQGDLPVIAIDSFRHMYVFPKYEDIDVPGKLKNFLQDLYSGKLHREFHYGPDEPEATAEVGGDSPDSSSESPPPTKSVPPKSQFQHLGPSKNRYTLLKKTEL